MKYTATGTDFDHSVAYTYDNLNNMTGLKETINGSMLTTNYTYDDDNRVTKVENSNNNARTYTYDGFGRLAQRTTRYGDTAVLTEDFTFSQTNIESQKYSFGLRSVTQYYEYDDNGNIVTFSEAAGLERGEEGFCTTYVYDSQNQLIRKNNVDAQKTWVWTYDNAGNITSRSEYAYTFGELGEPLDTVVYSYTNADWGDLLTSYDGKPITYDQIGNPLRIGSCRYSWEHGRQLASMFDGQNTAWHFTYDASGMRTSRSNGTTTYSYVYNGSLLMKMTVSNVVLEFAYDAFGAPMTITLNGSRYYYLTNVQGDVVSIVDADGVLLVHYVYDAWGNLLSTEGTMANTLGMINPLRYRGYVYDRETELYYLQSRYYNPEIGRFLNADGYISTGQRLLGGNMFSYCYNNPMMYTDTTGHLPWVAVILIGFAIAGGIVGYTSDEKLAEKMASTDAPTSINQPNKEELLLPYEIAEMTQNEFDELLQNDPVLQSTNEANGQLANEADELTVGDRVTNTLIGAGMGLAVGGAIVSVTGMVASVVTGSATTFIPALGGTGLQTFARGALIYDLFAMVATLSSEVEMEAIEYEP